MPEVRPSVCPLDCPDRCSLEVTVDGGRIIKINGSDRSPFTSGYICSKVRDFDRRLDSPIRVRAPMRRAGAKGSSEFQQISWDEAIHAIARRFRDIINDEGPGAILPYAYSGSNGLLTSHAMDERFWNRLGAAKLLRTLCAANTGAAWTSVFDDLACSDPAELRDSDAVVLWGVNPSASGIHLVPIIKDALSRGAYLCVVDPRATPLSKKAAAHLAVYPGTDVALALAMANIAIEENLIDAEFLREHARGFDTFAKATKEWTPERAAALARVCAESIVNVTRAIARARAPFFRVGWGLERNRNGTDAVRAVLILRTLFGKFNEKGAGVALSTTKGYGMRLDAAEGAGLRRGAARSINMSQIGRALAEGASPPIRALFVYNCNPVATAPHQSLLERALLRDDLFTIVHEQVWTDTCALADLVLPATTFLEHKELCRSYGGYAMQWLEPVIAPRGEARSNHWLFSRLAGAMGFTEKEFTSSEEEIAELSVGSLAREKINFSDLAANRYIPLEPRRPFAGAFPSRGFADLAGAGPPRYRPAPVDADKPIVLISPCTEKAISSTLYETMKRGGAAIAMNPSDARARNLHARDRVRASNSFGAVELILTIAPELPPGVACIPKGLWRHSTLNGYTANALAPDHVAEGGEGACYNDARVEVEGAPSAESCDR